MDSTVRRSLSLGWHRLRRISYYRNTKIAALWMANYVVEPWKLLLPWTARVFKESRISDGSRISSERIIIGSLTLVSLSCFLILENPIHTGFQYAHNLAGVLARTSISAWLDLGERG